MCTAFCIAVQLPRRLVAMIPVVFLLGPVDMSLFVDISSSVGHRYVALPTGFPFLLRKSFGSCFQPTSLGVLGLVPSRLRSCLAIIVRPSALVGIRGSPGALLAIEPFSGLTSRWGSPVGFQRLGGGSCSPTVPSDSSGALCPWVPLVVSFSATVAIRDLKPLRWSLVRKRSSNRN